MKGYGSAILLGTVVTEAELAPTEPIPESGTRSSTGSGSILIK